MTYIYYLIAVCVLYLRLGLVIAYAESCVLSLCGHRPSALAYLRRIATVAITWPVVVAVWLWTVGRWIIGRVSR